MPREASAAGFIVRFGAQVTAHDKIIMSVQDTRKAIRPRRRARNVRNDRTAPAAPGASPSETPHKTAFPIPRPTTACRPVPGQKGDRHGGDRTPQRMQEGTQVEKRHPGDQHRDDEDRRQRRRERQHDRGQDRKHVDRRHPGRGIAQQSHQPAERRVPGDISHATSPRARLTSEVVLWPCRMSTSITVPPLASTISWPTTVSRV